MGLTFTSLTTSPTRFPSPQSLLQSHWSFHWSSKKQTKKPPKTSKPKEQHRQTPASETLSGMFFPQITAQPTSSFDSKTIYYMITVYYVSLSPTRVRSFLFVHWYIPTVRQKIAWHTVMLSTYLLNECISSVTEDVALLFLLSKIQGSASSPQASLR